MLLLNRSSRMPLQQEPHKLRLKFPESCTNAKSRATWRQRTFTSTVYPTTQWVNRPVRDCVFDKKISSRVNSSSRTPRSPSTITITRTSKRPSVDSSCRWNFGDASTSTSRRRTKNERRTKKKCSSHWSSACASSSRRMHKRPPNYEWNWVPMRSTDWRSSNSRRLCINCNSIKPKSKSWNTLTNPVWRN